MKELTLLQNSPLRGFAGGSRPTHQAGVARGLTNNAIGSCLGISVETVKTHLVNAKGKLGASDRTQMAVTALLYGLIDPMN